MEFVNAFVQQFVLFLVFVGLALLAIFIGISLRKHKNKKEELESIQSAEKTVEE